MIKDWSLEAEKFNCKKSYLKKLLKFVDLRKAINFLQRCHNTLGDSINEALQELDYTKEILVKLVNYALEKIQSYKYITNMQDGYSLVKN